MSTADISVLPDELVDALNPLRRGTYRARAARAQPVMPAAHAVPTAAVSRDDSLGDATAKTASNQVSMRTMVTDVAMVLAWAAIIPGLMWLGAACGF